METDQRSYNPLLVQSPLAGINASSSSLGVEQFALAPSSGRRRGFSRAKSAEHLPSLERNKEEMIAQTRLKWPSKQFGPLQVNSVFAGENFEDFVVDVSFGQKSWKKIISRDNFSQLYSLLKREQKLSDQCIIPDHLLNPKSEVAGMVSMREKVYYDHVFLFFHEIIHDSMFLSNTTVGLNVCFLLDNDFQTLEMAYELQVVLQEKLQLEASIKDQQEASVTPSTDVGSKQVHTLPEKKMLEYMNLKPVRADEAARNKVYTIMFLLIKNVLGCRSFKFGSSLYRTYLPEEPILITICSNNKDYNRNWFKILVSFLCGISIRDSKSAAVSALGKFYNNTLLDINLVRFCPKWKQVICAVNGFQVIISANEFENLCFFGFFEELNRCVLPNGLFKDTVFFLRASIFYKMKLYQDAPEQWSALRSLDAYLMTFLFKAIIQLKQEHYDFSSVDDLAKKCLERIDNFSWEDEDLIDTRYFTSLCDFLVKNNVHATNPEMLQILTHYENRWQVGLAQGGLGISDDTERVQSALLVLEDASGSAAVKMHLQELRKTFEIENDLLLQHLVDRSSFSTTKSSVANAEVINMKSNLSYFELIMFSVIQEEPLLLLIKEILFEKGPLPVGEVGKVLQLNTNNTEFTQLLKEQFGGLKKLLETHYDQFYMAQDHPYNPKLYLREILSEQDIFDIENGMSPRHYINQLSPNGNGEMLLDGAEEVEPTPKSARKRKNRKKKQTLEDQLQRSNVFDPPGFTVPAGSRNTIRGARSMVDLSMAARENMSGSGMFSALKALEEESPFPLDGTSSKWYGHQSIGTESMKRTYPSSTTLSSLIHERSDHDESGSQENFF